MGIRFLLARTRRGEQCVWLNDVGVIGVWRFVVVTGFLLLLLGVYWLAYWCFFVSFVEAWLYE